MSLRKQQIDKERKEVFRKPIVQDNPSFTVQEIDKFYHLFNLYADDRREANIYDMVSTAKTLRFDEKFPVIFQAMIVIADEYDGKWVRFQTFLTDLTRVLGNPQSEDGRRAMFELADIDGKQKLTANDLIKISDGLGFSFTFEEVQKIMKNVSPTGKDISWDQFNEHISKRKVDKK